MKGKPEHVIACASEYDRDQWLRCYKLIIQMKTAGLDLMKIDIVTFERFQNKQGRIIGKRRGLFEDEGEQNLI